MKKFLLSIAIFCSLSGSAQSGIATTGQAKKHSEILKGSVVDVLTECGMTKSSILQEVITDTQAVGENVYLIYTTVSVHYQDAEGNQCAGAWEVSMFEFKGSKTSEKGRDAEIKRQADLAWEGLAFIKDGGDN